MNISLTFTAWDWITFEETDLSPNKWSLDTKKIGTSLLPIILVAAGLVLILGAAVFYLAYPFKGSETVPTDQTAATVPYPNVARVSLKDAKAAYDLKNAVFIDVRGEPFYSEEHIPSALSITYDELPAHIQELKKTDWIIPYCT
jgi:Rhodanese-like domain